MSPIHANPRHPKAIKKKTAEEPKKWMEKKTEQYSHDRVITIHVYSQVSFGLSNPCRWPYFMSSNPPFLPWIMAIFLLQPIYQMFYLSKIYDIYKYVLYSMFINCSCLHIIAVIFKKC